MTRTILFLLFAVALAAKGQTVREFPMGLEGFTVRDFCMMADRSEAYFTVQSPLQDISQLCSIKNNDGGWGACELLPFCDEYMYLEPFLSQDGRRLYFVSNRPLDDSHAKPKDFDIWYVERLNSAEPWSVPINVGAPVNTDLDEFYPSLSANGNLYLTKVAPEGVGKDDIYVCRRTEDGYLKPELVKGGVNTAGYEFNAFVSTDETLLVYTKYNAEGGHGSGDLYVSMKNVDGEWADGVNLGSSVNSTQMDYCPFYDENLKVLYFTSRRSALEPKCFEDAEELFKYISIGENGASKVYFSELDLRKVGM